MFKGEKIKVLFIAGASRSGTTLLDSILGQIDGLFAVGEARELWRYGIQRNGTCGCGAAFGRCDFWQNVLHAEFPHLAGGDVKRMVRVMNLADRRYASPLLLPGLRSSLLPVLVNSYPATLARVCRGVKRATGCEVIVNSSKTPSHAYLMRMSGELDVYVVHLLRDPRATAFSWQRKKLRRWSAVRAAAEWAVINGFTEALFGRDRGRYLRIRYEDFVLRPRQCTERILDMLGVQPARLPFSTEHDVELKPCHDVLGNPRRFETGMVHIHEDNEWRTAMSTRRSLLVTLLMAPMLRRYGYPMSVQHAKGVEAGTGLSDSPRCHTDRVSRGA